MEEFSVACINRHRIDTDGKGVTTLVGLSGCHLKCKYCINKKLLSIHNVKKYTGEKLLEIIIQDYCYFIATGGGVTFGGGEPLLQYKQIHDFRQLLPSELAINIETSLNVPSNNLENLLDIVDKWIIDIKDLNATIYKIYTEENNNQLLHNLDVIVKSNLQNKCRIRIPMIPNYNTKEDIDKSIKIIRDKGFTDINTFDYIIDPNR